MTETREIHGCCQLGWGTALHLKGMGEDPKGGSADFHYLVWVDQFDTLGMGKDVVILNGARTLTEYTAKLATCRMHSGNGRFEWCPGLESNQHFLAKTRS